MFRSPFFLKAPQSRATLPLIKTEQGRHGMKQTIAYFKTKV
jgi:hypothetical protein